MNIAVVGLWHLGTVTAACVAAAGFRVIGVDENTETIAGLAAARLPVAEPGLAELIQTARENGDLSFTADVSAVAEAELVWVTYDTPVDEDDHADVTFVVDRITALFPFLQQQALVIISSQLPVGSTRRVEGAYHAAQPHGTATFAYVPENLRLGKAIEAFTRPERVVVGIRSQDDQPRIATVLRPFTERIEWMSVESAEMTKHAVNAFLATSVAFINELAVLCERVGADAREVERGLKSESRIGPRAYVRPGGAFAGGTLARDVTFLLERGQSEQVPVHLFAGVLQSNEAHKQWARHRLRDAVSSLAGKTVAVLGLTYKPGTNTLRRSSAIEICRWLHTQGAIVIAYDPVISEIAAELLPVIRLCSTMEAAVRGAHAALIATEWPAFSALSADDVVRWMAQPLVLDPNGFLEKALGMDPRITYLTVGRMG